VTAQYIAAKQKNTIIYRFTIPEIRCLVPLLCLYEVKWSYRVCLSEETAFCMVLARLAVKLTDSSPSRQLNLAWDGYMSPGQVSLVRDVLSGILRIHSFMCQLLDLYSGSWSLFHYVVLASQLAGRLFPVSLMRGHMPLYFRSHAISPTSPCATS
jgi:hypothetical protein